MTAGSAPTDLPSDSRLSVFLSYAVLLAGIGAGIASAYIVITTYSPLPHWDEWALFDHLATSNASLSWLWAQHNEHRILVPKLFFLLDLYFFRGKDGERQKPGVRFSVIQQQGEDGQGRHCCR